MTDNDSNASYVKQEFPQSELTGRIIAAAQQVHRHLGPGYEEVFYQRALALELPAQGLDFSREVWIDVIYRGKIIGRKCMDFVIEEILVEIKARSNIEDVDVIQAVSYLRASGYQLGLLLNFGAKTLQIKRRINTAKTKQD